MSDGENFTRYTTEEKKEFAKQFTPREIQSYHKGRRNAYSHMANIGKNHSFFVQSNLEKDAQPAAPPPKTTAPPKAAAPKPTAPKPAAAPKPGGASQQQSLFDNSGKPKK